MSVPRYRVRLTKTVTIYAEFEAATPEHAERLARVTHPDAGTIEARRIADTTGLHFRPRDSSI